MLSKPDLCNIKSKDSPKNKLIIPKDQNKEFEDKLHKARSFTTKQRVMKYEEQQKIDKEVCAFFDKISYYPKSNMPDALNMINRNKQKQMQKL